MHEDLHRHVPSQISSARQKIQMDMVEQLSACRAITTEAGLQLLIEMVSDTLGRSLQTRGHQAMRAQIVDIIFTCAKSPDGLPALVEAVARLVPETWTTEMLQLLLDEWQAADLFTSDDWSVFRAALGDLVLPELAELFAAATRSRMHRPPTRCTTAWQIFVYLAGLNAGADALPPSMIFLDLLADIMPGDVGQEIRLRNRRRASSWGLTPALNTARSHRESQPASPVTSAYLVIQLEADGVDEEQYVLSHWHQWDTGAWRPARGDVRLVHRDDLEKEVERLIFDIEATWSDGPATVTLEFILPWELLNAPVDWWYKESLSTRPTPLTMDYPVVVRSLERLRTRRWHRAWHARWQRLKQDPGSARTYWSKPAGHDYHTLLETELKSDDHVSSLVLSEPPDGDNAGRKEIEAALRSGLPVIVWQRSGRHDSHFREALSLLVAAEGLADLPVRARELRRQALRLDPDARDNHIGRHLTVLWDDPERQPEVSRSSGAFEEGSTDDSGAGWRGA